MSEEISALADQEIDEDCYNGLVDQLCGDPVLRERWQRYHLIRSALRGECTTGYFNSVYTQTKDRQELTENSSRTIAVPWRIAESMSDRLSQWWGGWAHRFGIVAGLAAALTIGLVVSSFFDFRYSGSEQEYAQQVNPLDGTTRWRGISHLTLNEGGSENHLNELLLAHGDAAGYPPSNGLTIFALMVASDR